MQDPGLEYERLISQENRFYMAFYAVLVSGASTLYFSYGQLFDPQTVLMSLGFVSFSLAIVAVIWQKKVEALNNEKLARINFLKKNNAELRDFYAHVDAFSEETRKQKNYHSVLPSTFYDVTQTEILVKLSLGATILYFSTCRRLYIGRTVDIKRKNFLNRRIFF